jgi:hypothetical protein
MDVDLVILRLLISSNGKMITLDQLIINSVAVAAALAAIIIIIMAAVMERHMSCRLYQLIIGTMWHSTLKIISNTTVHLMN